MQVFIVGSGKLAEELLSSLKVAPPLQVQQWRSRSALDSQAIVVHAGSGRELSEVVSWCRDSGSVLVELATGSMLENQAPGIPVVLCPNANILMLKFMHMVERSGHLFQRHQIALTESHQSTKTSAPGTAIALARSLGLLPSQITSVRDAEQQATRLGIPAENLARHAFHRIDVQEGSCTIRLEATVLGASPYASGVAQVIRAISQQPLEQRLYYLEEFLVNGWI
ncbi:dihydrodipicolinate reductase [Piscinibacter sp. HJYY11]|nr:dihydrodipicolinate reductase [Piscinibacter sp. HJYY11]